MCFIIDAYSRMIVGWRVASHMRTEMVLDAIEMARWSRGAQLTGLLVLLVAMPLLGPASPTGHDLLFGSIAGIFGGTGIVLLYRALATGPMSVVAPTTALAASVIPILAGIVLGERPGGLAVVGIAVSLVAVVLITRDRSMARAAATQGAFPLLAVVFLLLQL